MPIEVTIGKVTLLLGMSFFFGLAFESFYLRSAPSRPGGIRTFPLLALSGAFLYLLEPQYLIPFACGLIVLGAWLYPYYRSEVKHASEASHPIDGIMVPVCNLFVYVLGPVVLTQASWVAIGVPVLAVLLLRAREQLHKLAKRIPGQEIITLAQFLILIGVVLPILPRTPISKLTTLTPFQVWLAVVVVSTISYISYLLQRFVSPKGSLFFASLFGGMYSSTATTVVLARRMKRARDGLVQMRSGIILATAVMYLRIGLVVAIFNVPLAVSLAPWLVLLAFIGVCIAFGMLKRRHIQLKDHRGETISPGNPLEIGAAIVFAFTFVLIDIGTHWIRQHVGTMGIYGLAAVVGVTDIDPFVLSLAHGTGQSGLTMDQMRIAILIAASSNNLLKAVYTIALGGWRAGRMPLTGLFALAGAGLAIAAALAY